MVQPRDEGIEDGWILIGELYWSALTAFLGNLGQNSSIQIGRSFHEKKYNTYCLRKYPERSRNTSAWTSYSRMLLPFPTLIFTISRGLMMAAELHGCVHAMLRS